MKTLYEAQRPRLTAEERQSVWDSILTSSASSGSGVGRILLTCATAGMAVAIIGLSMLPHHRVVSPGPELGPEEIASSSNVASSEGGPTPPSGSRVSGPLAADSLTPPSSSIEPAGPAGQDRPVAADRAATPSRRAADPAGARVDSGDFAAGRHPSGTIYGTVRDSTGKPLPYANLLVLGTRWGGMSGERGQFSIPNLPPGIYSVKAMHMGYADVRVDSVEVHRDYASNLDFELNQMVVGTMDLVEIAASRERIRATSRTGLAVRSSEAENLPVDEITELIGLKAGVVAQGGELHFRGGRGGEVHYKVDGIPVRDPLVNHDGTPKKLSAGGQPTAAQASPSPAPRQPPVLPVTGGSTLPNDEVYDSVYFEHYGVNPFIATDEDSLSTFAADVDAASYTVSRQYIALGHLPPKEAVRVEEFINFFDQGYPEAHEPDFRVLIDGAPSPFGPGYHLLRIGVKARVINTEQRKPANLTFVIDISGSMAREDRLELVKKALEILIAELRPDDRVGLVVYDTNAREVMEPRSVLDKETLLDAIHGLAPQGSTNAAAGLDLGYKMARRNYEQAKINRIILCTDGVANEGVTSAEAILGKVRLESDRGIALSTVGFGMGNYNDVLLEKLADTGDGDYYYVDRLEEAARVFRENLTGTLETVARDMKIQVAFDPRRVARYRLLGFENRDVADRDFRNDRVDAGEIGAGHEMTALYEVKLADSIPTGRLATVRLRYAKPEGASAGPPEVCETETAFDAGELAHSFDEAQPRFRLDAAVAETAEILRHSFWAKESRLADLLPVIRSVASELSGDREVVEFATMVENATRLSAQISPEERGSGTPDSRSAQPR